MSTFKLPVQFVKPDNYCARIAFVDYDGPAAYEDYRQGPPSSEQEKEEFFTKHASRMLKGAGALENYLNSRPEGHLIGL